jgi:hypothetical protein
MTELPAFAFSSVHDAVLQLQGVARELRLPEFHTVAYQRFRPEDDWTWWLSPEPGNPVYAYGKLVVEKPSRSSGDQPLIGFHIEKGVGAIAAPAFVRTQHDRNQVMASDWAWYSFLRAMRSGAVDRTLGEAAEAADGLPLRVVVVATPATPGRLEPDDDPRVDAETVWYDVVEGRLRRAGEERVEVLAGLGDDATFVTIADAIDAVPPRDLDWRWLEILAGLPFRRNADGALSAREVWQRACAPWLRWVK